MGLPFEWQQLIYWLLRLTVKLRIRNITVESHNKLLPKLP